MGEILFTVLVLLVLILPLLKARECFKCGTRDNLALHYKLNTRALCVDCVDS